MNIYVGDKPHPRNDHGPGGFGNCPIKISDNPRDKFSTDTQG